MNARHVLSECRNRRRLASILGREVADVLLFNEIEDMYVVAERRQPQGRSTCPGRANRHHKQDVQFSSTPLHIAMRF